MSGSRAALLLCLLLPSVAFASDYTGFLPLVYTFLVVGISSAIHLVLILVFSLRKKYHRTRFLKIHILFIALPPALGILWSLNDYKTESDLYYLLLGNAIGLSIILIPILVHLAQAKKDESAKE
ncbi:hypothetical protein [Pleionea sp. CnH1-48]|uniref:hypothetical protein n=1 Tax=Pleionea sp. CnH1-48 TaxID=2954494 RepID=UPI002096AF1F|nr:hypothetical protein [Pleionea sp. CnH1-48]MCO7223312.1 hypothetical protein [Pleionea sp. CnH1-48]